MSESISRCRLKKVIKQVDIEKSQMFVTRPLKNCRLKYDHVSTYYKI